MDPRIDRYAREADENLARQRRHLFWWRTASLILMLVGFASLALDVGPVQIIASIVGCVWWRDIRNREMQLGHAELLSDTLVTVAAEIDALKARASDQPGPRY